MRGVKDRLEDGQGRLRLAMATLEASSPEAVLARGFAVVRRADGTAVRDAGTLAAGDRVEMVFAKGGASASIEETRP